MRTTMILFSILFATQGWTTESSKLIKFNYAKSDILKVVSDYAAAANQRFIVDADVRGTVTLVNPSAITLTEAYNQMSMALAGNGYGIAVDGEQLRVMSARILQRSNIPVVTEIPTMAPERMVTWIYRMKFVSADDVNKQLRILTSRDGELVSFSPNNELLISDWTSNLVRIAAILKEIDVPPRKPR